MWYRFRTSMWSIWPDVFECSGGARSRHSSQFCSANVRMSCNLAKQALSSELPRLNFFLQTAELGQGQPTVLRLCNFSSHGELILQPCHVVAKLRLRHLQRCLPCCFLVPALRKCKTLLDFGELRRSLREHCPKLSRLWPASRRHDLPLC